MRVKSSYAGENYYDNICIYTGEPISENLIVNHSDNIIEAQIKSSWMDATMCIAVYDKAGKMKNIQFSKGELNENLSCSLDVSKLTPGVYCAKVFVIDSLNSLRAHMEPKTVNFIKW